jgi:hypothetical protein
MVDQRPFLVETLTQVDNNTFPFHQHLKVACDLLPPLAYAYLHPFKQFIGQQMVQLQYSILECLRHHTLSNMLSDGTSKAHHAQILSCFSPRASVWFKNRSNFLTFLLFSLVFCTTIHM